MVTNWRYPAAESSSIHLPGSMAKAPGVDSFFSMLGKWFCTHALIGIYQIFRRTGNFD